MDAAITSPVFAEYSGAGTGSLGDMITNPDAISFSMSGTLWPPNSWDLSGSDFSPAGTANEQVLQETAIPYVQYTFFSDVTELAIYIKLRPTQAGGPTDWTISSPSGTVNCAINSGLAGATISGSTLTPDPVNYQEGVILCSGNFRNITLTKNGSNLGFDFITIAVDESEIAPTTTTTVPEPTTTTTTTGGDPVTPAYTG